MGTLKQHWEAIYTDRDDDQLSWFEADPERSVALVERACADRAT